MEKVKSFFIKLVFPPMWVMVISVAAGTGLLIYTFGFGDEDSPVAYISYVVSAYALVVACTTIVPAIRKLKAKLLNIPLIYRYLKDIPFKMSVSLHLSLLINLMYACMHGFSGLYYGSAWSGSLAAYYICLSVMRFFLVRYAHQHGFGKNKQEEWRRYRLCGILLTVMTLALAGVVILVLNNNEGFEYGGMLIYVMAMYTFYITVMAVINVIRYVKYQSPAMSAARSINLAAALVSMLSLETAMLSQFDTGEHPEYFRQLMVGISGSCVCGLVVGLGIYMIVRSSRQIKNNKFLTDSGQGEN